MYSQLTIHNKGNSTMFNVISDTTSGFTHTKRNVPAYGNALLMAEQFIEACRAMDDNAIVTIEDNKGDIYSIHNGVEWFHYNAEARQMSSEFIK
jgi:hypothetical protein